MTASTARVTAGRFSAVLAVACAVVHVALADVHAPVRSLLLALVMAAASLTCLANTRVLWRAPTRRVWRMTCVMNAVMLGIHCAAMIPVRTAVSIHAAHSAPHLLMQAAMILAVAQTFLASAVLQLAPAAGRGRSAGRVDH